ncbi:CopG family transcriptional regulator [Frankia sp. AgB1.9]|uniref:CopG family transcriptional regulator n=1 Tax=unclassified Frankia TaxID=2632575 RepID=UPI001933D373|nr:MULTISPECIES: CopG family transcriptional regulator [unclassified Frankia]MBL7487712.1 CopG family transcriptional regulator [Frankia sp. AgW1.1]MBL7548045.1 CopG family transcriptional regulator [Frankia sp. AgB1.9]MBL7624121.1 CopG family transcriptional regulator [Frankia sp. AgB1.8]
MGAQTIMISVPDDLLEEVRAQAGEENLSAYITEVLRRQLARDRLGELVDWLEGEYGPITDEERAAARLEMDELRAEHARRRAEGTGDRPRSAP